MTKALFYIRQGTRRAQAARSQGLVNVRHPRGYILLMVLMLTALLSVSVASLMYQIGQSSKTTSEVLRKKRVFYETDGMTKAATKMADSYFRENPTGQAGLAAWFEVTNTDFGGQTPKNAITPAGYDVDEFTVSAVAASTGALPNGPYMGMNAYQIPLTLSVRLRDRVTKASSKQSTTVIVGQVSAFQFFIFSEGYTDLFPYPDMAISGRSHVNGDFCLGGRADFPLEKITASGRILHIRDDPGCRATFNSRPNLDVAVQGSCPDFPDSIAEYQSGTGFTCTFDDIHTDQDSGCSDPTCSGGWAEFVEARFRGSVADNESHGVTALQLPIIGVPLVQAGVNSEIVNASTISDATESNRAAVQSSSRLLVDPLLAGEPADVAKQKFACKADLRIINGVWYLRENPDVEDCDDDWPGAPIWSDHPGNFTVDVADFGFKSDGDDGVGQRQIATDWNWDSTSLPRYYSYYRANNAGLLDTGADNRVGIISYGTLARITTTTPAHYVPGFRTVDDGTMNNDERWCGGCTGGPCITATTTSQLRSRTNIQDARNDVCTADFRAGLLQATRSGYKDGHYHGRGFSGDRGSVNANVWRNRRAKQLPMNFDVAVFQAALADIRRGELGWHFDRLGREFNGIIWITNTWPGQNKAYSSSVDVHAETYPMQGSVGIDGDARDGDATDGAFVETATGNWGTTADPDALHQQGLMQQALPYNLCGAPTTVIGGVAGERYDHSATNRFVVPDCSAYAYVEPWTAGDTPPAVTAYLTSLRIINGANYNPTASVSLTGHVVVPPNTLNRSSTIETRGLSIVTPTAVVIVGDYNTTSDPSSATATPWTPALVGGDVPYTMSNNWNDDFSPWNGGTMPNNSVHERDMIDTEINLAVLGGWAVTEPDGTPHGGGMHNFLRHLERGNGALHLVRGSFFNGHRAVLHWTTASFTQQAFNAPPRDWGYDRHFDAIANQPPGAPQYSVNAVRSWRRD